MTKPVLVALVALALVGCDASRTPPPATGPATSAPVGSTAPDSTAPPGRPGGPTRLPAVVLVADLSRPPAHWDPVVFLPFGGGRGDPGIVVRRDLTPVPIVPPSFAVDPDGSFWLLDLVKHRVAHYSRAGVFLGDVRGLAFDRFHPYAQDLGFAGGRLFVLEAAPGTAAALVRRVSGAGLGPRVAMTVGTDRIVAQHFVSPLPHLSVEAIGTAGPPGGFPTGGGVAGDLEIDPTTGAALPVDGVRLGDRRLLGIEPKLIDDGQEIVVRHRAPDADGELPVRVRVRHRPGSPTVRASIGWHLFGATAHSIVAYVQLATAGRRGGGGGGGQWLFQLFDDGSPLEWEPLPRSPLRAADIKRDLAVGFDGAIYLMLASRAGVTIYRRPG